MVCCGSEDTDVRIDAKIKLESSLTQDCVCQVLDPL